jgi:predicted histidine transporter YuiF (NhaC family)
MSLTPIVALLQRHLRVSVVVALTAAALAGGVVAVYAVPAHANWKVEVLRDRKSDQCYVAILLGNAMSITGPSTCPN